MNRAFAQFPNPLDFNTATNATNTGTLPVGANDLHWTAALTNSLGPYVSAVVCGNQAPFNWANSPFPNANWITYPHTCSAGPAEHSCLGNVDEFYKLIVNLPSTSCNQSVATPSAYCLSLDFFADNWVSAIYVNNVLSFNNPNGNPYGAMGFTIGGKVTVSLCNNWIAGSNTVIVHVKSGAPSFPGWTGFLAQANQTVNTTVGVPVTATVTQNNVSCFGGNNGSATVTASGAAGPYTYTWLPPGGNSSTASNLTAGNYSVIVASAGGCQNTQTFTINQPAQFSLTVSSNTTICNGGTVSLSASGAISYSWSTGSNQQNIIVTSAGIYSVAGSNSLGCISTNTISVSSGNNPTVMVSGPASVCPSMQASIVATGANSYTWSNGSITNSLVVNPSTTIVYTVTGTDAGGICFNSTTFTLQTFPVPNIMIAGNNAVCDGGTVTLTATGADTYTWNNASNSSMITVNPSTTTLYQVVGTEAIHGCTNTANTLVQVGSFPSISVSDATLCAGGSAILTASGASTYTWSNNSEGNSITVSPVTTSIYTVYASGTLPQCIRSETVRVSIIQAPLVTLQASSVKPLCLGDSVRLTANGATYYYWSNGAFGQTISITPSATTVYSVNAVDPLSNCSSSGTILVSVVALQNPTITTDETICEGDRITLTANGANDYLWSNGSNSYSISILMTDKDVYTVTGIDISSGCSASSSIELLSSEACCQFFIPNTFTPNEDGKNELFGPKSLCKFTDYKFYIYDRWGEKIFSTDKLQEHWNGYYKGKLSQEGVYVYLIEATRLDYSGKGGNKYIRLTGHVNLLK